MPLQRSSMDSGEGPGVETYGPRLYANFKPTKPPENPTVLIQMLKKSLNSTKNQHATLGHNLKACVKLKTEQDEPTDYHQPQIIDQLNDDAEGLRLQLSPDRYN